MQIITKRTLIEAVDSYGHWSETGPLLQSNHLVVNALCHQNNLQTRTKATSYMMHTCDSRPTLYGDKKFHLCCECGQRCCQVVDGETNGCAVICQGCRIPLHRRCALRLRCDDDDTSLAYDARRLYGCHQCVEQCDTCRRNKGRAKFTLAWTMRHCDWCEKLSARRHPFYRCNLCDRLLCSWCFRKRRHPAFCVVQTTYDSLQTSLTLSEDLLIGVLTFLFGEHPERFTWAQFRHMQTARIFAVPST